VKYKKMFQLASQLKAGKGIENSKRKKALYL